MHKNDSKIRGLTHTKSPIASLSVKPPRSIRNASAGRQDGLHSPVGMLHRLSTVRVSDELRVPVLAAGNAVGMLESVGWGTASNWRGVGGSVPLRSAGRQLDEVVLLGVGVPLGDPAGGQVGRRKGRAVAAR